MGKKQEFKHFVIVNPKDRINQMWMINTLAKLHEEYPHLQDKIEPATSVLVEEGKYILARSI